MVKKIGFERLTFTSYLITILFLSFLQMVLKKAKILKLKKKVLKGFLFGTCQKIQLSYLDFNIYTFNLEFFH